MKQEKRYQIFISSTFRDLVEERQAVLKATLELDHMPAGMELFPAADDTAWNLIKDVIDASDYYILIIGGRYGSLDEAGIGYTEKEYDYAKAAKKPVIPFLHANPNNLPREKTEVEEASWKKLEAFRRKVEDNHTCVYWGSSEDLKAKVIVGLTATVKRYPTVGWIRADQVPSEASLADQLALRKKVAELESEIQRIQTAPPIGAESLLQGKDSFPIKVTFSAYPAGEYSNRQSYMMTISPSWDGIFSGVAPTMISETSDFELRKSFQNYFMNIVQEDLSHNKDFNSILIDHSIKAETHDMDTCIIQLRALGLIEESQKKRSVRDTGTYWTLTPYGDLKMVQLRALRP